MKEVEIVVSYEERVAAVNASCGSRRFFDEHKLLEEKVKWEYEVDDRLHNSEGK